MKLFIVGSCLLVMSQILTNSCCSSVWAETVVVLECIP